MVEGWMELGVLLDLRRESWDRGVGSGNGMGLESSL